MSICPMSNIGSQINFNLHCETNWINSQGCGMQRRRSCNCNLTFDGWIYCNETLGDSYTCSVVYCKWIASVLDCSICVLYGACRVNVLRSVSLSLYTRRTMCSKGTPGRRWGGLNSVFEYVFHLFQLAKVNVGVFVSVACWTSLSLSLVWCIPWWCST